MSNGFPMGLLSILSLLPSVILLDGNGASPDDALRNGAATNDLVPLYMWVAPETKRRFVEMCHLVCNKWLRVPFTGTCFGTLRKFVFEFWFRVRGVTLGEEENVSISEMLTRWASRRAMAGEPLQGDSCLSHWEIWMHHIVTTRSLPS